MAAFFKSGFEPWVITMSDLLEQRTDVSQFHGLVFCGGFSFGVRSKSHVDRRMYWIALEVGVHAYSITRSFVNSLSGLLSRKTDSVWVCAMAVN